MELLVGAVGVVIGSDMTRGTDFRQWQFWAGLGLASLVAVMLAVVLALLP